MKKSEDETKNMLGRLEWKEQLVGLRVYFRVYYIAKCLRLTSA